MLNHKHYNSKNVDAPNPLAEKTALEMIEEFKPMVKSHSKTPLEIHYDAILCARVMCKRLIYEADDDVVRIGRGRISNKDFFRKVLEYIEQVDDNRKDR